MNYGKAWSKMALQLNYRNYMQKVKSWPRTKAKHTAWCWGSLLQSEEQKLPKTSSFSDMHNKKWTLIFHLAQPFFCLHRSTSLSLLCMVVTPPNSISYSSWSLFSVYRLTQQRRNPTSLFWTHKIQQNNCGSFAQVGTNHGEALQEYSTSFDSLLSL